MTSKLAAMQARFQQKQIQEREEKLLRLYEHQQQRAFERVGRGSAGSNTSLGSTGNGGGGKVRQMFDERRQKAGVDRSYPLEPLAKGPPPSKNGGQTRGGSVDRLMTKNNPSTTTNSRTVIKSTVQKSVSKVSNGKPIVSKREVVRSIYNNNDGDESYEQHRYEDDNEAYVRPHRDLVDMLNDHNLNETLDYEVMPQIGFDEVDTDAYFAGKLANVGGRLPSQSVKVEKKPLSPHKSTNGAENGLGKTFRKEAKPIIRRSVRPAGPISVTEKTSSHHQQQQQQQPIKTVSSSPVVGASSPVRSAAVPQTMSSARQQSAGYPTAAQQKAPSATRPSAKQGPKISVARDDLAECKFCKRRFATDRLQVHEQICSKTIKKKRKTYDATKHRVEGTELEPFVRRGGKGTASSKASTAGSRKSSMKKDWRRTHEEFINAIRAAKQAQAHVARGGKLTDLPPPPPSSNPDYVQCPHCGRKFNETAAERHIPKCASYSFNKPKPGAPPGKNTSSARK